MILDPKPFLLQEQSYEESPSPPKNSSRNSATVFHVQACACGPVPLRGLGFRGFRGLGFRGLGVKGVAAGNIWVVL